MHALVGDAWLLKETKLDRATRRGSVYLLCAIRVKNSLYKNIKCWQLARTNSFLADIRTLLMFKIAIKSCGALAIAEWFVSIQNEAHLFNLVSLAVKRTHSVPKENPSPPQKNPRVCLSILSPLNVPLENLIPEFVPIFVPFLRGPILTTV